MTSMLQLLNFAKCTMIILAKTLFYIVAVPIDLLLIPVSWISEAYKRKHWPLTVDEAVDRLLQDMSREDIEKVLSQDSGTFMYCLGQDIRNEFGLWQGNDRMIESCGAADAIIEADEASSVIIEALRRRLSKANRNNNPTAP